MDKKYKQDFLQAGALAREALAYGKQLIQPGASYNEVIAKIREKIHAIGGTLAFPPQMALDDVAAHFLPTPTKDILFSDQVVKLDIGVSYHGAIGDCATTVDLSKQNQPLIDAAETALRAAEKSIRVGQPLREIGQIIERTIIACGFRAIRNLSGHGLGRYQIHTAPTIPNFDNRSKGVIQPGMTFAIEPFASDGRGLIEEAGEATIFSSLGKGKPSTPLARMLWPNICKFEGLPFAVHDLLAPDWPYERVRCALDELVQSEILFGHAPLVERAGSKVAQAENSVLVDKDGTVFISTR